MPGACLSGRSSLSGCRSASGMVRTVRSCPAFWNESRKLWWPPLPAIGGQSRRGGARGRAASPGINAIRPGALGDRPARPASAAAAGDGRGHRGPRRARRRRADPAVLRGRSVDRRGRPWTVRPNICPTSCQAVMQPGAAPGGLTDRSCHTRVGVRAGDRQISRFQQRDFQRLCSDGGTTGGQATGVIRRSSEGGRSTVD